MKHVVYHMFSVYHFIIWIFMNKIMCIAIICFFIENFVSVIILRSRGEDILTRLMVSQFLL